MSASLTQAIEEMRNMRESYDQLAGAAEAYNTGKAQLATNITAKGVQASSSETLPQLASKVAQIAQSPIVWDESEVGDQYAVQLFGDGALWNLYEVLKDCKNTFLNAAYEYDGDTYNYKALIVCEYYRGYDQLKLQGADAYYTCDGDFYDYDALHTWHDYNNGKANRWVCFMFGSESGIFNIMNTSIAPRSMYIGGTIGEIKQFVNGRLTELVCGIEERDKIISYIPQSYTNPIGQKQLIIRGVEEMTAPTIFTTTTQNPQAIVLIGTKKLYGGYGYGNYTLKDGLLAFFAPDTELIKDISNSTNNLQFFRYATNIELIYLPSFKHCVETNNESTAAWWLSGHTRLADIWVGEADKNLPTSQWNPTAILANATAKAQLIDNIKNHILARVGDRTGLSQLMFTVSTNMFNNIASEQIEWHGETMTLADAFLTKNWLLAGA